MFTSSAVIILVLSASLLPEVDAKGCPFHAANPSDFEEEQKWIPETETSHQLRPKRQVSFGRFPYRFSLLPSFHGLQDWLKARYDRVVYTLGNDEETKIRSHPGRKNLFGFCPTERCDPESKYRTFAGHCNNIDSFNSDLGRHSQPMKRLLPPEYTDSSKVAKLWSKATSRLLPNPRQISALVHGERSTPSDSKRYTIALMQFGQFLDHDITLTPMMRQRNGSLENCWSCDSMSSEVCMPIPIPEGDEFFPSRNPRSGEKKCMDFVRSVPTVRRGVREQINKVTAWLDSSHIYGSFLCHTNNLRQGLDGKMKVLPHPLGTTAFKPLMPRHATNHECDSPSGLCFNAGDDRSNEQPGLTSMHTLFLREHNRIAEKLAIFNPRWSDEKLFQETRKIIIAVNQHITFKYDSFLAFEKKH